MTHNEDLVQNKTKFIIAGVALAFCIVWALIGESSFKIIAVSVTFMCFLYHGINTEMSARALDSSH